MDVPASLWESQTAEYWRDRWGVGAVHLFERAGSTNDIAHQLAAAGTPDITVIIADEQTRGRGRSGNTWEAAPASSLLFSIVLYVPQQPVAPGCAPLRLGVSVAQAAHGKIKWPNDVIIEGQGKVAGILCEGSFSATGGYIVAGIGINVLQTKQQLPPNATSTTLAGLNSSRADVMTAVMQKISAVAGKLTDELSDSEVDVVHKLDVLLGKDVVIGDIRGRALGVTSNGALRVSADNGEIREVLNGSVRLANEQYPGT